MKLFYIAAAAVIRCAAPLPTATASWGTRGCLSVERFAAGETQGAYKWWTIEGRPNEQFLYWGNTLAGVYDFRDGFYRPAIAGKLGNPTKAPIPPPFGASAAGPGHHLFGLEPGRVGDLVSFSHNGVATTREEAEGALARALADDSLAPHLTHVAGDPERRKSVTASINKYKDAYAALRTVRFQSYDPNLQVSKSMLAPNKLGQDLKFQDSKEVLIAQPPATNTDGTSRPEQWYGVITEAQVVEALRKAVPAWDPNKPLGPLLPELPEIPWGLIFGGAAVIVLLVVGAKFLNN